MTEGRQRRWLPGRPAAAGAGDEPTTPDPAGPEPEVERRPDPDPSVATDGDDDGEPDLTAQGGGDGGAVDDEGAGSSRPTRSWSRLLTGHGAHPRRAQVVVALLCGLLGFALATQVDSNASSGLSSARQSDLIDVLDNLNARSDQLRAQIAAEQDTLNRLTGGNDQTTAALQEAQQRAQTLQILAGTVAASGPGIDLAVKDPTNSVTADVMLDILEELRDAGAEAVEIKGNAPPAGAPSASAGRTPSPAPGAGNANAPAVRLVASSYFLDSPDARGIVVDGTVMAPPYDIVAIGDPQTLSKALGIPGGVLDTLESKHAGAEVTEHDVVQILALHTVQTPQYARPAPTPSASAGG